MSQTRSRLLRYTAPFSLAGVPAVAIPCAHRGVCNWLLRAVATRAAAGAGRANRRAQNVKA